MQDRRKFHESGVGTRRSRIYEATSSSIFMQFAYGPHKNTWLSYDRSYLKFSESESCCGCDLLEKKKSRGMAEDGDAQKNKLKLYSYWRSSCSCRVRIALNLKGLEYQYVPVNLVKGEQLSPDFLELNPIGYVPVLVDGGVVLADSFAILMYLEEKYPQYPLLPTDLNKKAINYQAANIVSSSIQPLQNLAVLKYIEEKVSPIDRLEWVKYHIGKGFSALEMLLKEHAGKYATGNEVYLADLFLAPQIHAAIKRFNLDMNQYPLLSKLNEAYMELPAFQHAMPEKQPDTPSSTT